MKILKVEEKKFRDSDGLINLKIDLVLENEAIFSAQGKLNNSSFTLENSNNNNENITYQDEKIENFSVTPKQNQNSINPNLSNILSGQELQAPEQDCILMDLDDEIQEKYNLEKESQLTPTGFGQIIKENNQEAKSLWNLRKTLTSIVLYKAYAYQEQVELYELFAYLLGSTSVTLPCPQLNIMHTNNCFEKNLYIKNFLLAPVGAETLEKAVNTSTNVLKEFKIILERNNKNLNQNISLNSNFQTLSNNNNNNNNNLTNQNNYKNFRDDKEILEYIQEALNKTSSNLNMGTCAIGLEIAAEQIYDPIQKKYFLNNNFISANELVNIYEELIQKFPIYSIESGMSYQDWQGWDLLLRTLANKIQIAKNFSNNPNLSGKDQLENVLNNNVLAKAIVIDPLKIGTITESLQLINLCKTRQINPIILATEDDLINFLSDFAIGTSAGQFKIEGNPKESYENKCKRLLEIEKQLIELGNRF